MNMELTPGEQRMAERARSDAEVVARLLSPPVSAQDLHDADRHLKQVAAAVKYLKDRGAAEAPRRGERPGRD